MQNFTYHTHNNELHFDGHHSAEEMIAAAEAKGFAEIGVSNHLICHKNLSNMPNYEPMFFAISKQRRQPANGILKLSVRRRKSTK